MFRERSVSSAVLAGALIFNVPFLVALFIKTLIHAVAILKILEL